MAVAWNGFVGYFVYQFIGAWNRLGGFQGFNVFRWFQAAVLVLLVFAGLMLIGFVVYAGYKLFVAVLVGRVEVEVDAHPLVPGAKGRARVSQAGPFALARVRVALVCTEEASYVAGTSRSTAREEVVRVTLSDPDHGPEGGRLPVEADFRVPPDAMHSFEAPNNAIKWTVVVTGRVLGLPFSDVYAVAVGSQGSGDRRQGSESENGG
jgi:hypothetical protein